MFARLALVALLLAAPVVAAQPLPLAADFTAPGVTGYDSAIPTPEEVIGHVIGTMHTRPEQVVRYFEAVAAVSPRVTLGEHGRTWEGRPLVHAIVAAPGTDLDAVQAANRRLSDAPGSVSDAALAAQPVVAFMGYSIHGNEASGTEAALLLLYHLAAGQGPAVDDVLAARRRPHRPDAQPRRARPLRGLGQRQPERHSGLTVARRAGPRARRAVARRPDEPLPLRPQPRLAADAAPGVAGADGLLA